MGLSVLEFYEAVCTTENGKCLKLIQKFIYMQQNSRQWECSRLVTCLFVFWLVVFAEYDLFKPTISILNSYILYTNYIYTLYQLHVYSITINFWIAMFYFRSTDAPCSSSSSSNSLVAGSKHVNRFTSTHDSIKAVEDDLWESSSEEFISSAVQEHNLINK